MIYSAAGVWGSLLNAVRCLFGAALCVCGSIGHSSAQSSLAQAVLIASEFDPNIKALRQDIALRGIEIETVRDEGRPQFGLSAETSSTGRDGPAMVLTVSQVLFDWGLVRGKVAGATQSRIGAVAELKKGIERLTHEISEYYIDIEGYDRKIALTRQYLAFAERIASHAKARAEAGRSDLGELARAELEVLRSKEELNQLAGDRSLALTQLDFLMGRASGGISLAPNIDFVSRFSNQDALNKAVLLSPDYILAKAEVNRAEADVDVVRAARLPSIRLQGQLRGDLERGHSRGAVGLTTGVDLGLGGLSGRQVQAAEMQAESRKLNMSAVARNISNSVLTAKEKIAVLRVSEASQTRQLQQADQVLANYEEQFVAGQRELLDLLTTGRDQYDARLDAIDTMLDRKRTEYEAAYELGVLGTMINAG